MENHSQFPLLILTALLQPFSHQTEYRTTYWNRIFQHIWTEPDHLWTKLPRSNPGNGASHCWSTRLQCWPNLVRQNKKHGIVRHKVCTMTWWFAYHLLLTIHHWLWYDWVGTCYYEMLEKVFSATTWEDQMLQWIVYERWTGKRESLKANFQLAIITRNPKRWDRIHNRSTQEVNRQKNPASFSRSTHLQCLFHCNIKLLSASPKIITRWRVQKFTQSHTSSILQGIPYQEYK